MKTVKLPSGVKRIDDSDVHTSLLQLQSFLTDERKLIIEKLEGGLAAYVDYQFNRKLSNKQLDDLKLKFTEMKHSSLELSHYNNTLQNFLTQEFTYIGTTDFYKEIDLCISETLNYSQLTLV